MKKKVSTNNSYVRDMSLIALNGHVDKSAISPAGWLEIIKKMIELFRPIIIDAYRACRSRKITSINELLFNNNEFTTPSYKKILGLEAEIRLNGNYCELYTAHYKRSKRKTKIIMSEKGVLFIFDIRYELIPGEFPEKKLKKIISCEVFENGFSPSFQKELTRLFKRENYLGEKIVRYGFDPITLYLHNLETLFNQIEELKDIKKRLCL